MSRGEKCHFCEHDRGPLVGRHDLCATCHHFDNFQLKKRMSQTQADHYFRFEELEELANDRPVEFDRATALMVLQDLVPHLRPSQNIFGDKTLVIRRDAFEAVRRKYLDKER